MILGSGRSEALSEPGKQYPSQYKDPTWHRRNGWDVRFVKVQDKQGFSNALERQRWPPSRFLATQ